MANLTVRVGLGVLIFDHKNDVLCAKRGEKAKNEQGYWEFPGGGIEFGETMEVALKREIREEHGIAIKDINQVGAIDHILEEELQHWVSIFFTARLSSGVPHILEPEKCSALGWFNIDNLPEPLSKASKLSIDLYKCK